MTSPLAFGSGGVFAFVGVRHDSARLHHAGAHLDAFHAVFIDPAPELVAEEVVPAIPEQCSGTT